MEVLKSLGRWYIENGMPIRDEIRGFDRVEIPALFSLGLDGFWEREALNTVAGMQADDGSFTEYPYRMGNEKVGYWGAVPTAFSVIALSNGNFIDKAVRAADFLLSKEKNGKFLKSGINRTDAINTNLLCAMALNETIKILPRCSERVPIYKGAIGRAILRSIKYQTFSGAFPYATNGFGISYIYHAMALSLLLHLYLDYACGRLAHSIILGKSYLDCFMKGDGMIDWKNEQLTEEHKKNCCWAYAWAAYPLYVMKSIAEEDTACLEYLEMLPDFKSDLFYTAWCMLPLWLMEQDGSILVKWSLGGAFTNFLNHFTMFPHKFRKYLFQLKRKSSGIDLGPIEYW